ncbi:MAG: pimeloyl-ACP methyl ester carboxylesterase [Candidatus Pseudothioglobus sp.]|jgi:pimeloyl-ACP methyl ester carboxylesterase
MNILKWALLLPILLSCAVFAWYIIADAKLSKLDEAARAHGPGAYLSMPEGKLHYRWDGPQDGPVVVLSHGFSTPNFIYEQNVTALNAAGFRTLRYDHFGRGWSSRPVVNYDIDFYDRTLLGLLDGLNITTPVGLVGLSMGGPITAEFVARHPERVNRLFLFVPAGLDLASTDSNASKLLRTPLIGDFIFRVFGRNLLLGDSQYAEDQRAPANRLAGDVSEQMNYRGYFGALLSTLRHMPMSDRETTFDALRETGVPVMAVYGDADTTVLVSSADKLQTLMPDAIVKIIAGGEHGLNYQRHAQVNPGLVAWFSD